MIVNKGVNKKSLRCFVLGAICLVDFKNTIKTLCFVECSINIRLVCEPSIDMKLCYIHINGEK